VTRIKTGTAIVGLLQRGAELLYLRFQSFLIFCRRFLEGFYFITERLNFILKVAVVRIFAGGVRRRLLFALSMHEELFLVLLEPFRRLGWILADGSMAVWVEVVVGIVGIVGIVGLGRLVNVSIPPF
jgi:hypothetical protein